MFDWNETFSVKIAEIDDQHKKLFEIGENINQLLKDHDGIDSFDEIMDLIADLLSYTKYHFEEEEKLLVAHNYPELEAHVDEHNKFIDYLENLDEDEIDENQKQVLAELIKFIATWIFKHINNTDFKYSQFLLERM